MPTKDQAATCIQAACRGFQWRYKRRLCIKAIIRLQALQRGRFTRREFAYLKEFSREQESFQRATRRRQMRIWHSEQELSFLQQTNAVDLGRVRLFQQQHLARLLQRCWRAYSTTTAALRGQKNVAIASKDRIYTFDPFRLIPLGDVAQSDRFGHWRRDPEETKSPRRAASLEFSDRKSRAFALNTKLPTAIATEENFASRRNAIQERIKRTTAEKKEEDDSRTSYHFDGKEASDAVKNRRHKLYQQIVALKHTTTQRVLQHKQSRALRQERVVNAARLIATCKNQIKHLRAETPNQMTCMQEKHQRMHDHAKMTAEWDRARRVCAWNHHRRAVCSVLDKCHWWQTHLAGEERDIRQVVMVKSPWEDESKIWSWPRTKSSGQEVHSSNASEPDRDSSCATWPSAEIQRFLLGTKTTESRPADFINDGLASEWWKAHCTQSHLHINGALRFEKPYSAGFCSNVTSEGDVHPICTTEMVANRPMHKLQRDAKRAARGKRLEQDIKQRAITFTTRVGEYVHEMEAQIEANTQVALKSSRQKSEQRMQISREQQSAVTIQRFARGMQGRHYARELRAEYFVMVRGRAIRRGRCEECGDQRAVLKCQQCEESLHFCPICWVHVHSTRRRKTHVAIPIVAPTPKIREV